MSDPKDTCELENGSQDQQEFEDWCENQAEQQLIEQE